jgi:hypothetical protein
VQCFVERLSFCPLSFVLCINQKLLIEEQTRNQKLLIEEQTRNQKLLIEEQTRNQKLLIEEQYKGQKIKDKRTNVLQNTAQKTKDRATFME